MGERSLQHGKDLCMCIVDYEKAFDRVDDVDVERYWSGLEGQKFDCKIVFETQSSCKSVFTLNQIKSTVDLGPVAPTSLNFKSYLSPDLRTTYGRLYGS